jgi:hypothetical protein
MLDLGRPMPNTMYKHRIDNIGENVGSKYKPKPTRLDRENELWDAYFGGVGNPVEVLEEINRLRGMM